MPDRQSLNTDFTWGDTVTEPSGLHGIASQNDSAYGGTRAVVCLTLLIVAGCTGAAVAPARPTLLQAAASDPDIYPLAVGMTWTYTLTQAKDGVISPTPGTMTSRVASLDTQGGVTIAKVDRTYGTMTVPATEVRKQSDGVSLARWPEATRQSAPASRILPLRGVTARADGEVTTTLRILQFPLQAAASWPGRQWSFAKETLSATGWESLTVPAGTFKSWHVTHRIAYDDGRQDTLGYWYAPGSGMVKAHEETTMMTGDKPVKYSVDGELTGFRH